jgi:hypothetical protein
MALLPSSHYNNNQTSDAGGSLLPRLSEYVGITYEAYGSILHHEQHEHHEQYVHKLPKLNFFRQNRDDCRERKPIELGRNFNDYRSR